MCPNDVTHFPTKPGSFRWFKHPSHHEQIVSDPGADRSHAQIPIDSA
jgi:hypothetical protein